MTRTIGDLPSAINSVFMTKEGRDTYRALMDAVHWMPTDGQHNAIVQQAASVDRAYRSVSVDAHMYQGAEEYDQAMKAVEAFEQVTKAEGSDNG